LLSKLLAFAGELPPRRVALEVKSAAPEIDVEGSVIRLLCE